MTAKYEYAERKFVPLKLEKSKKCVLLLSFCFFEKS